MKYIVYFNGEIIENVVLLSDDTVELVDERTKIEVLDIRDTTLDTLTDLEKPEYIRKWYKVVNNQLEKRTSEWIQNIIFLSTDAQDTVTPLDGIPDVPADGTTVATITVEVRNPETNAVDTTANDILYVMTDRGKLSAVNVQLTNGIGSFTIKCSETVVANIRVWEPNGKYKENSIKIQFRPV